MEDAGRQASVKCVKLVISTHKKCSDFRFLIRALSHCATNKMPKGQGEEFRFYEAFHEQRSAGLDSRLKAQRSQYLRYL